MHPVSVFPHSDCGEGEVAFMEGFQRSSLGQTWEQCRSLEPGGTANSNPASPQQSQAEYKFLPVGEMSQGHVMTWR